MPTNKTITYTYAITRRNGEEMRVSKNDGTTTKYIWDAANIVTETDELNVITTQFTYDPVAYGNLISMRRSNNTNFYHFDALGSTQALTNASETITNSYLYNAFGEVINSTGNTINPYRYVGESGYYFNTDTGLYTLRRREYNASDGQFVSFDPIHFNAGDLNLYRYVGNNPSNTVDPSGLIWGLGKPIEQTEYSLPDVSCERCMPNFTKCAIKARQHNAGCLLAAGAESATTIACVALCEKWAKTKGFYAACTSACILGGLGNLVLYAQYICP